MSPLVPAVTTPVTPYRHEACSTVLDPPGWAGHSTAFGGDVAGTHDIAVPSLPTTWTAEDTSCGFGDALVAVGTRRRRATLIDQHHLDARLFGLVTQRPHQMGAAPLAQPQVMRRTRIQVRDALGVADHQRAGPAIDRPRHHALGRQMMRLAHAPAMPRLLLALAGAQLAPPATPPLPASCPAHRRRRRGGAVIPAHRNNLRLRRGYGAFSPHRLRRFDSNHPAE